MPVHEIELTVVGPMNRPPVAVLHYFRLRIDTDLPPLRQFRCPPPIVTFLDLEQQSPRCLAGLPDDWQVDAVVRPKRLCLVVDLDNDRVR